MELPALVGCDLVHCERQAAEVVLEGGGSVLEAQGELITTQVGCMRWTKWIGLGGGGGFAPRLHPALHSAALGMGSGELCESCLTLTAPAVPSQPTQHTSRMGAA